MNIKERVLNKREDTIEIIRKLVKYNSVLDNSDPKYIFGKANHDCLTDALSFCTEYGFSVKNLDNYCGYAEIGSGDYLIGILGHLDIVPAGDGWNSNPFELVVDGSRLYGRGAADDKGPVVAGMMALRVIDEMYPNLDCRVRLIMGSNEESGFECIKHYVEVEGHIDAGFTPDGPFPLCFGEKGIIQMKLTSLEKINFEITGGLAFNSVSAKATAKIDVDQIDRLKLENYFRENNIEYEISLNGSKLEIIAFGQAAHSASCQDGINANCHLMMGLNSSIESNVLNNFANLINTQCDGENLKANFSDEYGSLTLNVGKVETLDGYLKLSVDIRVPVTVNNDVVIDTITKNGTGFRVEVIESKSALFFAKDSKLVKNLLSAYQAVTGSTEEPVTMGGGTYARAINNCVAFGPSKGNVQNNMHNANEFVDIEDLMEAIEIYVLAIINLIEDK